VFGSRGSGNFLTKMTALLAFVFLVNSLALAYMANQRTRVSTSLMDSPIPISQPAQEQRSPVINEIPAQPDSGIPFIPE
jgi:preprotein translocase subunit SecG